MAILVRTSHALLLILVAVFVAPPAQGVFSTVESAVLVEECGIGVAPAGVNCVYVEATQSVPSCDTTSGRAICHVDVGARGVPSRWIEEGALFAEASPCGSWSGVGWKARPSALLPGQDLYERCSFKLVLPIGECAEVEARILFITVATEAPAPILVTRTVEVCG